MFIYKVQYLVPTASPPKTLTLDVVMDSARDLSNLSLAHEMIVNGNFCLEPKSLPQDRYVVKSSPFGHTLIMFCGLSVNLNAVCQLGALQKHKSGPEL